MEKSFLKRTKRNTCNIRTICYNDYNNKQTTQKEKTMTREQLKNLGYNDAAIDLIMEIIKEGTK